MPGPKFGPGFFMFKVKGIDTFSKLFLSRSVADSKAPPLVIWTRSYLLGHRASGSERRGNDSEDFEELYLKVKTKNLSEKQGQNLASTVLRVPYLLGSGTR